MEIKNVCSVEDDPKRITRLDLDWEKYLQPTYLTKDLYLENIKDSQTSTVQRQTIQLENG